MIMDVTNIAQLNVNLTNFTVQELRSMDVQGQQHVQQFTIQVVHLIHRCIVLFLVQEMIYIALSQVDLMVVQILNIAFPVLFVRIVQHIVHLNVNLIRCPVLDPQLMVLVQGHHIV